MVIMQHIQHIQQRYQPIIEMAMRESFDRVHTALGTTAIQIRDDLLGVWATTAELGKRAAGDLYRRKKSLPVLHALENASGQDKQILHTLYRQEAAMTQEQADTILAIFLLIALCIFIVPTTEWLASLYCCDYFDRDLDKQQKGHRPLPSGRITERETLICMIAFIYLPFA